MAKDHIDQHACRAFIRDVFLRHDLQQDMADKWAYSLVETSLMGIDSHGIRMLDRYVNHVKNGGIARSFTPKFIREKGAIAVIDGGNSSGHVGALYTTDQAIDRAKKLGIGAVSLIRTNHVGACALYAARAARHDCIGLCFAVTVAGIAPWGGKKRMLGINPVAIGFPVKDKPNFVLDISTSVTAMGKITRAADMGQTIPEGWAFDSEGKPTTDPQHAREGSLYPMGEHKGYGLAMAIEAVTAMLSGGTPSMNVLSWIANNDQPMGASFMTIALDIDAFSDKDDFKIRALDWVTQITASPRKQGVERIYYPGERSGEVRKTRETEGIPVDDYTKSMFGKLALACNINQPLT